MAVRKIRWFRVYDDLVDDPKVQRLSCENFRALVNLWCLTSANGGTLPDREHIGFKLRLTPVQVDRLLDALTVAGLLDGSGDELAPHNWKARQFKSDGSSERVRKHRAKQQEAVTGNVDVTLPVTPPETENREQRTEKERKEEDSAPRGARVVDAKGEPYAFDEGIIQLNADSLAKWQRAFSALDVPAELMALAHWATNELGKERWFPGVANALNKKNRVELARRAAASKQPVFRTFSGMDGIV